MDFSKLEAIRTALRNAGSRYALPKAVEQNRRAEFERIFPGADETERLAALGVAVLLANRGMIALLVERGVDPDACSPSIEGVCVTPLHLAAASGAVSVGNELLVRGADPSLRDSLFDGTVAEWAKQCSQAAFGRLIRRAEVLVPAIQAIRRGDVEALRAWLDRHPDEVDARLDGDPRTLLHYALAEFAPGPGADGPLRALLDAGADPNLRCTWPGSHPSETPLHHAAAHGQVQVARALIEGGARLDPTGGRTANGTPLFLAVLSHNWEVAELLVDAGAEQPPLMAAALGSDEVVARWIQEKKPGRHSLGAALYFAALGGRAATARLLCEAGGDIDTCGPNKTTVLDVAHRSDSAPLVELLRSRGAKTFVERRSARRRWLGLDVHFVAGGVACFFILVATRYWMSSESFSAAVVGGAITSAAIAIFMGPIVHRIERDGPSWNEFLITSRPSLRGRLFGFVRRLFARTAHPAT